MDQHLHSVVFASDDDPRCVLEGSNLPFRYGRADVVKYPGRLIITIKADSLTEKTMNAYEPPGFFRRLWARIRGR